MYREQESVFYYLTVMNEQYAMPAMPRGRARGHPEGHVSLQRGGQRQGEAQGAAARQRRDPERSRRGAEAAREVRRRRRRLERDELQRAVSRRPRVRALEHAAPGRDAAGALRHAVPEGRAGRHRRRLRLHEGAAGLDRSLDAAPDARRSAPTASAAARTAPTLREFFEVDARFVAVATLAELAQDGQIDAKVVAQAIKDLGIDPEKPNPAKR